MLIQVIVWGVRALAECLRFFHIQEKKMDHLEHFLDKFCQRKKERIKNYSVVVDHLLQKLYVKLVQHMPSLCVEERSHPFAMVKSIVVYALDIRNN